MLSIGNSFELCKIPKAVCIAIMCLLLGACSYSDYAVVHKPNYDNLVGKVFSEKIYMGRKVYKVIKDDQTMEELENRRSDGCILVFGVTKNDDIIRYWRIDSEEGSCLVSKKAFSR